jgi:hypothetical protein
MSQTEPLQFDRAEFENPAAAQAQCAECNRSLTGSYYDVNGRTVCEACRYTIESRSLAGSGAGRFLRAAGAGLGAAIAGALLYYAISALTGYEFGLIAIVVGFAVGSAVRWGSNGRGGWMYQSLAILLTYFAIVSTYIPPIVEGLRTAQAAETAGATATPGQTDAAAEPPATPAAAEGSAETTAAEADIAPVSPIAALLILLAIASVAPFLVGFQNIIGLIIIGIGLYEAWKLNRREVLTITGPHAIAPRVAAGA